MDFSSVGPMSQLILLTALDNYTSKIASMSTKQLQKEFGPTADFLNTDAWHRGCVEMQAKIKERYK